MAVIGYEIQKANVNPELLADQLLTVLGGLYHGLQFDQANGKLTVFVEDLVSPAVLQQARTTVRDHVATSLTAEQQRVATLKESAFWRLSPAEWKAILVAMSPLAREQAVVDAVLLLRDAVRLLWHEVNDNAS